MVGSCARIALRAFQVQCRVGVRYKSESACRPLMYFGRWFARSESVTWRCIQRFCIDLIC